ncbi:MAG: hypothetical protein ACSHWS_00310 [Sulfitobacter sp.]
MRLLLALILLPTCVFADGFARLEGDTVLAREQVVALTAGRVLRFYEGGQSRYSVGGAYSYSYESGATAFGHFDIKPDGEVCVTFTNGRQRCDIFVHSHGRLVLLTEDGGRYPVRP